MLNQLVLLTGFVGILIGSMLFFAITVAPTVFKSLPEEQAGKFLRAFFPRYYLWGLVMATITAAIALMTNFYVSLLSCLIAILFLYARQRLMPQINSARDDNLEGVSGADKLFKKLHLRSVIINGIQLLLLIAISVYLTLI